MRLDKKLATNEIVRLLSRYPSGLTSAQLTTRLGYTRSTVTHVLSELTRNATIGTRLDEIDGRHWVFFLRSE